MGKRSRNKGSAYEREIAAELFDELGMTFTRNLEQVRTAGEGDLICDDTAFPFLIECKRRKDGGMQDAWMQQAAKAAEKYELIPTVFYRMDRHKTRCVVPMWAMTGDGDFLIEMSLPAFCQLAREMMAKGRCDE